MESVKWLKEEVNNMEKLIEIIGEKKYLNQQIKNIAVSNTQQF